MTESIADLERRRDLLKEIKELSDSLPGEDEMEKFGNHLATLIAIENHDAPDEDHMKEISDHLETLAAIEKYELPDEDVMKAASDHLATLKEIEDRDLVIPRIERVIIDPSNPDR